MHKLHTSHIADVERNLLVSKGLQYAYVGGRDLVVMPYLEREEFVLNCHMDLITPHLQADKLATNIQKPHTE